MYITYSISLPLHLPTSFPISSSLLNLPPLLPFTLQMYLLLLLLSSPPQPLPPPPPFVLYFLLSRYHGRPWSGGSDRVLPV